MDSAKVLHSVGRRKSAIARVYLAKGEGSIVINHKELSDYFFVEEMALVVKEPLEKLGLLNQYNLRIHVAGGGLRGQSEAIRLGVARALALLNPEEHRPLLKKEGLLKRDARVVERKKYGQRKARKRFQFTKR